MPTEFSALLTARGLSSLEANVWLTFVEAALGALRKAESRLREPQAWEGFRSKKGAMRSDGGPSEEGITAELGHLLKTIRKEASLTDPLRELEMSFETECLVEDTARTGRSSRRIDILIASSTGTEAPALAVEAKLLLKAGHIKSRYLAEGGIGCFRSVDSPYTRKPVGAMLAYVLQGTDEGWRDGIHEALRLSPEIAQSFEHTAFPGEQLPILCSDVSRPALGLGAIVILHLVMRFQEWTS